jgi:hypothetical protein
MMDMQSVVVKQVSICASGHCRSICLSVLHVFNVRASRHHLLSYPYELGITKGIDKANRFGVFAKSLNR